MVLSSEFSQRPLIAGDPLVGLRSFVVDGGRLTAFLWGYVWASGENLAECNASNWPGHHVASRACQCGFYAYYDGSNQFARAFRSHVPIVTGIIEGYGAMVIGTLGFRCEKARIVALVRPTRVKTWRYSLAILYWALAVADMNSSVGNATHGRWWATLINLSFAVWFVVFALKQRRPRRNEISPAEFQCIQDNYSVPVYRSVRAALKAHPLTPVPELLA